MQKIFGFIFLILLLPFLSICQSLRKYDIRNFGAKSKENFLNTEAINKAIQTAYNNGGGTVVVPSGIYSTATIYLKSNVNIYLEKNAVLQGSADISKYQSFIPSKDLSQYSTISTEGNNSNSAYDSIWTKALIIGQEIQNVTISGEGVIDGEHVFNAKGEENMRGAHTIILANARNITWENVTIEKAGNYAILGYDLTNTVFQNIQIKEGWDGIHIRGGNNILIRNCNLQTGDDAIAGGYWHNFVISDCKINSSCNGIRIIMPVDGVTVAHSIFEGPGIFAHRTSGAAHRTNMLAGIYIQPGGWGVTKGDIKNVTIEDIQMHNMDNPLLFDLNKENNAYNIYLNNILADSIRGAIYLHSHYGGYFDNVSLHNITISFLSRKDTSEPWALSANNIQHLQLQNVIFNYPNNDQPTAIKLNNVAFPVFEKVQISNVDKKDNILLENSGDIQNTNK